MAAMLLPEMYAVAMYANSAIPAAACFVWAIAALMSGRHFTGGVLLCLAPLLRVDVVAVYPVLLPLFLFTGYTLKKSLALCAVYGAAVLAADMLLFWCLRADVLVSLTGYSYWNGRITTRQVLSAIFGFYSLACMALLPLGLYAMLRLRQLRLLLLVLMPVACLHLVYRSMGCAAKHYLYAAPFVITASVVALRMLRDWLHGKTLLRVVCVAALVVFLALSVRVVPAGRPWFGQSTMYNGGVVLPLCSAWSPLGEIVVGIGAGQYVPTEDEYMIATGHLFYPWYIHTHKAYLRRCAESTATALDSLPSLHLLALSYATRAPFMSRCLADGYVLSSKEGSYDCTLTRGSKRISIQNVLFDADDNSEATFRDVVETHASGLGADALYVLVNMPRYQHYLDNMAKGSPPDKSQAGCLRPTMEKVTDVLYKYRLR